MNPPNPPEFHYACAHNEVQVLRDLLIEVGTGTEILNKALKVREIMTMVDVGLCYHGNQCYYGICRAVLPW